MARMKALLFLVFSVVAFLPFGSSSTNIIPAFLWSSHQNEELHTSAKEVVDYRTISSKELAHLALSQGGWLNLACSGEKQQDVDVALIFLGRKIHSSDLSRNAFVDPFLIDLLELSFTSSNFSMAFPYVIKMDEKERIENSLISGLSENCGNGLQKKHIAVSEACSIDGDGFTKLSDLDSVQDYMISNSEKKGNIIVYCNHNNEGEYEPSQEEGEVLSKLISSMKKLGARYSVLYTSDPFQQRTYGANRIPYRSLAESSKNASDDSKECDGVCEIKASLLEGLFVVVVLLIILISGLCCMMGITTPSRFETLQES